MGKPTREGAPGGHGVSSWAAAMPPQGSHARRVTLLAGIRARITFAAVIAVAGGNLALSVQGVADSGPSAAEAAMNVAGGIFLCTYLALVATTVLQEWLLPSSPAK
jgi:hypothetical protein